MADENVMDIEILNRDMELNEESDDVIKKVAVIGGGVMGQGISILAASKGLDVFLFELNEDACNRSKVGIEKYIDSEIARWTMTPSEKRAILSRVQFTWEALDAKYADIVIEAVNENFETKAHIMRELDAICPPETIFITNTAALSISALASQTQRPDKIVGMHFLNPVPKIPLVELVRARMTSDETVQKVKEFAKVLDKTAVEVYEYPGYITTRIIVPLINEAMHVVMEGVATAEGVDTAMKLGYNFPIGPLALADQIGLDELFNWMETLFKELGDFKYKPCPLLRKMVRDGKLGKKTGEGFFVYQ
jgi:3-hydroxybutyryl-CoA dehydrogenase